jgi:xanthine dehydrogenase molybdenum-binding subunit
LIFNMKKQNILEFKVNGQKRQLSYQEGSSLADLLREKLGLTGTKVGCDEGVCGTCTVLIDGKPRRACTYEAEKAAGKEVLTIEGLTDPENPADLHPLQKAFVQHGAIQCGFCTPGQIMTAYSLLLENQNPDQTDIQRALRPVICRCGGYPAIESAVKAAAYTLRTGNPLPGPKLSMPVQKSGVGSLAIRPDAVEKANGQALFTADLTFPDLLHARVKRAGVPHAILQEVQVEKARRLPGVIAVLTAEDLPGAKKHGLISSDWPILVGVGERIRYPGDAVALVAAESLDTADRALDLIELEVEPQPVVSGPVQAHDPEAPQLHEKGNLLKHIKVRKGDLEQGQEDADLILEHTFTTPTMEHAFLELECSIARPTEEGRMEVYVGSQIPYEDRRQVAEALGWEENRVRIVGQLVGGAFGGKEDIAGQIHAALLAQAANRPVKLEFTRPESMITHPKRHATQITVQVGAKRNGELTAVKTTLYGDTGAYASLGEKVMTRATTHSSGPYQVPHVGADCYAMYTNNPPAGAFRGFGALQSIFAVENLMDRLAERLELDPIQLRRMNALREGSETNTGQVLNESVGLLNCIDAVQQELTRQAGENPFQAEEVPGSDHLKRAWGFAVAYKNTGLGGGAQDQAGAEVELYPNGQLEVRTSSAEIGQGLVGVLRVIVADQFDVPNEQVNVLVMDTDLTPDGGPTTASRQTYVAGNAARLAAEKLKQHIKTELQAEYGLGSETIQFQSGAILLQDRRVPLSSVAEIMLDRQAPLKIHYLYTAPETKPLGEGGDMHFAFGFGAQAVQVEVNTRSGKTRVLNVIAANDVGKVINPLGLQGQIEGGVVMGIGHALMEEYELEQGVAQTERLAHYQVPRIADTPNITSLVIEEETQDGPYGAKGVGELVSMPTIPAITNAIYNAVGVRVDALPVNARWLRRAIKEKEA